MRREHGGTRQVLDRPRDLEQLAPELRAGFRREAVELVHVHAAGHDSSARLDQQAARRGRGQLSRRLRQRAEDRAVEEIQVPVLERENGQRPVVGAVEAHADKMPSGAKPQLRADPAAGAL